MKKKTKMKEKHAARQKINIAKTFNFANSCIFAYADMDHLSQAPHHKQFGDLHQQPKKQRQQTQQPKKQVIQTLRS